MDKEFQLPNADVHLHSSSDAFAYLSVQSSGYDRIKNGPSLRKTGNMHIDGEVSCLCVVDSVVWIGDSTGKVSLFDGFTGDIVKSFSNYGNESVSAMRVVRNFVWIGFNDGYVRIYDGKSKNMLNETKKHRGIVTDFGVGPDFASVYSSSADCQIRRWSSTFFMAEGSRKFGECGGAIWALAFFGTRLFSGSDDSRIIEWNTLTRERVYILDIHTAPVLSLTISNGLLWSGSVDGALCIWSLSNKSLDTEPECIHMITNPHEGPITTIKTVGLKVWSVSGGELFIWNPLSFELEAHCGLRKKDNEGFNLVEVVEEVACSKIWISQKRSGDIVGIQSFDVFLQDAKGRYQNDCRPYDVVDSQDEKEHIINELLKTQKTLREEICTLQAKLQDVQSRYQEKSVTEQQKTSNIPLKGIPDVEVVNTSADHRVSLQEKKIGLHSMNCVDENILKTVGASSEESEGSFKSRSKITNAVPQYVVVDVYALLEKLAYVLEQSANLTNVKNVICENSFIYFTEEKGAPATPMGFIVLAELNKSERMTLESICGSEIPYVLPPFSELNDKDKEKMFQIIRRVRPSYCLPSSASPHTVSAFHAFTKSTAAFYYAPTPSVSETTDTDDIGYPPISSHLNSILRNIMAANSQFHDADEHVTRQRVMKHKTTFGLEKNYGISGLETSTFGIGMTSLSHQTWRKSSFPFKTGISPRKSSLDEASDGLVQPHSSSGSSLTLLINEIHKKCRHTMEALMHHDSSRVRSCVVDFIPETKYLLNPSDALCQLNNTYDFLIKRLCSTVRDLESELPVDNFQTETCSTGKILQRNIVHHRLVSPSFDEESIPPGVFSLISQVNTNIQIVQDLIIKHLLEVGRRIAVHYGRLVDALLQRHKPSVRPSFFWGDNDSRGVKDGETFPVSTAEKLKEYDDILGEVHALEEIFFA